jgi:hypothetical protein
MDYLLVSESNSNKMDKVAFKPDETLGRLHSLGLHPDECNLLMALIENYANGNFYLHIGMVSSTPDKTQIVHYLTARFPHFNNFRILEILDMADKEKDFVESLRLAQTIAQFGDC